MGFGALPAVGVGLSLDFGTALYNKHDEHECLCASAWGIHLGMVLFCGTVLAWRPVSYLLMATFCYRTGVDGFCTGLNGTHSMDIATCIAEGGNGCQPR